MKKLTLILIVFIAIMPIYGAKLLTKTLPNGMEVVVKESSTNQQVAMKCFVKTGSIHENKFLGAGISHYLEHIVSGGTTSKHTEEEYNELSNNIGAMKNAYTIFNGTVYEVSCDNTYFDDALMYISETVSDCAFDSFEVAREKEVIIKEFVYRVSPPQAQVRNRVRYNTFQTSNVRYEVIGYIDLYKQLERKDLIEYYNQRYAPNNMVFVAVGNFDADTVMSKIEKAFENFERRNVEPVYLPEEKVRTGIYKYIEEFDIQSPQGYVSRVVSKDEYDDYPAIDVAIDILFSKRTSPVNYRLTEELKKVGYVYGYFNSGGRLPDPFIQIGWQANDPGEFDDIMDEIYKTIADTRAKGITQAQIDDVINRYKAGFILKSLAPDDEADKIGWNMVQYGYPEMHETYLKVLEQLTPADIEKAIDKYFLDNNRVIFYALPKGEKAKLLDTGDEIVKGDLKKIELDNNTTLLHKRNSSKPVINGEMYFPLSSQYETVSTVGLMDFMITLMFYGGSKNYNSIDLQSWQEDHAATLYGATGDNGTFVYFKCIKEDFPELKNMIQDIFNNPTFPEHEIELYKRQKDVGFQRSLSDPDNTHKDFRNSNLYPGQKAALSSAEQNAISQAVTRDDLIEMHKKYFKGNEAIVTIFGDLTEEEAIAHAKELRAALPKGTPEGETTPLVVPTKPAEYINQYDFEQVNVNLNYPAPKSDDPDYYAMKVVELILSGGSDSRLHNATRGVNDLAYFASAYYADNKDFGFFRVTSQTGLEKKDELIAVLKKEIQRLKDGDLTQDDIDLVITNFEKLIASYFTDDQLLKISTNYEALGKGYTFFYDQVDDLKKVTPEMVKNVANKYFNNEILIVSYPNDDLERAIKN